MNYKYYTIVILGLLAFSACEKDDIDILATDNEVNQWIEQTMRENYLWYSEFPDKSSLDFSLDPESFFKGLLSYKDGKELSDGHHYFSQLEKATVTKSIYDANNSYGFDFATSNLKTEVVPINSHCPLCIKGFTRRRSRIETGRLDTRRKRLLGFYPRL